ncbi:unnamed protein product [Adineta steineri]|uniref:NACHT domain-containing protein n=1 Tax=Adineta steineri TaxID=433720 RepID=A0A814FR89_9BILA|nr:unnamed protein product [Adineta steineri]
MQSIFFSCTIPEGKHVMLSYHSSSQDIVVKIYQFLQEENIPVCLADGVENAEVVCCFITSDYEKAPDCKLELQYAQKRHKRIIKCLVGHTTASKPCEWLEQIITDLTHIEFDDVSEPGIDSKTWELLGLIKAQPLTPQHLLSKSLDQPSYLFELIRHEYQQHSRISRIMNPSRSFSIEQSYINLVIVETKEQQLKEKKLLDAKLNDEIIETFEEIYGTKTDIEIKDIFQRCDNQTKNVLVLGRAGIGKTTFCQYVAYQWATDTIWQQYDLVILFHLRNLTDDRYPPLANGMRYSLVDLVQTEYFHYGLSENDRKLLQEQFAKSQVLWLLDGYDEIVQNIPQRLKYLREQLLRTSHHVVTSRPYLNTLSYTVQLEITGFTNDNIKEYVGKFFDQIKGEAGNALADAQNLLSFLKCNPRVWGIVHIPVNLELICTLWCNTDWLETTMPIMTMTTVYDKMTEWLCRRHLEKQNISSSQMGKEDVYIHCHKELAFLESLAFHGMESNSVIIRPKLLQIASKESQCPLYHQPPLLNIGILKSLDYTPIGISIEADKNHYFVHLSFQEHFAARYLVRALDGGESQKKKAIDFIKAHKYNQRFELILTFASGLLNDGADERRIKLFWGALLGEPLDLIGLRHAQVLISCIEETGCNRSLPHFCEAINTVKKWIRYFVSNKHTNISHPLSVSLRRSPSLVNQSEILDVFKAFHKHIDPAMRTYVYLLIADLPIVKTHLDVIRLYLTALNDKNTEVRCGACFALSKMGEKAATTEVVKTLLDALEGANDFVRASACKALGTMSEKAAISDVLNSLKSALKNADPRVRSSACKALGDIGGKAATPEIINRLLSTLKDENYFVRTNASQAIGEIARKTSTNEIINTLVHALGSIDDLVKSTAFETLVKMGKKELNDEVINRFMSALRDPEPSIRKGMCEVLGIMGEKVGTIEVLNGIARALTDKDSEVRRQACVALGEIGEKAAIDQVINILVTTLTDTDLSVRDSAAKVLMKMGKKGKNIEVIKELVILLRNKDSEVRRQVCITLGWMAETATTDEVINSLVSAVMDNKNSIRNTVYERVCDIAEKEGLSEVVYGLSSALVDTDRLLRESARQAISIVNETREHLDVIDGLVSALSNQDSEVRWQACVVLGEMSKNVPTDLLINNLLSALADVEYFVRRAACEALGMMVEKVANIEVVKGIMSLLTDKDSGVRRQACVTLGKMGEEVRTDQVTIGLANALVDTHSFVRASACKALGKVGEKTASLEVINGLASALKDETVLVRREACVALGAIGRKAATDQVVNNLVRATMDVNQFVRDSACIALRMIRENITIIEAINKIEQVPEDEDSQVSVYGKRYFLRMAKSVEADRVGNILMSTFVQTEHFVGDSPCAILRKMSENVVANGVIYGRLSALVDTDMLMTDSAREAHGMVSQTGEHIDVINRLVSALSNQDSEVRRQACAALHWINDKLFMDPQIDRHVIDALVTVLHDVEYCVRSSACQTLGKMGEKAPTDQVVNSLLSALSDVHYWVRRSACEALGKMGEKAGSPGVINGLVCAMTDKDSVVRRCACEVLGKMGEKAANIDVINGLVRAVGDTDSDVKDQACAALGKINEKAGTSIVIHSLVSGLYSAEDSVRRSACEVLGKMGEKAGSPEVINGLVSAMTDKDSVVRRCACEALGKMGEKAGSPEVIDGLEQQHCSSSL